ncbi:hypothetical protein [Cylindrospermopsis curvispora]|uniref:Uncharacterized protein n=1 Tax=Cylindrospermopsis curvispora GIHE-G1 TaxID=2666332 RepID=A0A7H0F0E2_9CYAN|nr:hypothetical protein [Cylindrospermopsis curvispora]QNP29508.1 hypothetical protein IAR63_17120 [Cylindrospermopsis curvispora GIHE-G1]
MKLNRRNCGGALEIANPSYPEILPKTLASVAIASLTSVEPNWLNPDGTINPQILLDSFLEFWRQHGESLLKSAPYLP